MALTATTELQAINTMLSTIGESPVNSLDEVANVVDAVTAKAVLQEVLVAVQEEGWDWNTEKAFELSPDLISKQITVPSNCVEVDTTGRDRNRNVVLRGSRLYDKDNQTYQFTSSILCDLTLLLDFEEIPQAARHYVMIRAARVFQQRMVGSETLGGFTEKDEKMARAAIRKNDAGSADYNILTGNYGVMRIIDR